MAALRHARLASLSARITLNAAQITHAHLDETSGSGNSLLNSIQKRYFHRANFQNIGMLGSSRQLRTSGFTDSHYGVGPTWCVCSVQIQRNKSTDAAAATTTQTIPTITETPVDASVYIPEPPVLPSAMDVSVNALGEPSLASMGLGSYFPPGLFQQGLEFIHVSGGLPWWGSIVVATLMLRTVMFPINIYSQRNLSKMHNVKPKMEVLQKDLEEAKLGGNVEAQTRAQYKLRKFMTKHNYNPLKSMYMPLAQVSVMLPVFIGLRKMANLPVESMRDGGLWWFPDLTASDPYYILPLMTAATLLITMEVGADGVSSKSVSRTGKIFLRCIPVVGFSFMCFFPAALNGYWFTSNLCSLFVVALLKPQHIRKYFKIPEKNVHPKVEKKESGIQALKNTWKETKFKNKARQRAKLDQENYKKAGHGPLTKTYSYDPTKTKVPSVVQSSSSG